MARGRPAPIAAGAGLDGDLVRELGLARAVSAEGQEASLARRAAGIGGGAPGPGWPT